MSDLSVFKPYVDKAIEECHKLSFIQKTQGLFSMPEILEYFAKLPLDESNAHLALTLKELLPSMLHKKILIVGGGTGRLGRYIAEIYPQLTVTEIDSSAEMVSQANTLAKKQYVNDRFISIQSNAQRLPFADSEYDYVIAYGVFRYIPEEDQAKALSEIMRVSKGTYTVAEPLLGDLIHSLKDKIHSGQSIVEEILVTVSRMSLFYMLFKEYRNSHEFRTLVDSEVNETRDYIEVLTSIAGVTKGVMYKLVVS